MSRSLFADLSRAINVSMFAQINGLVGSGILAAQTTQYLGDISKAAWLSAIITILTLALTPILSQVADYWGRRWPVILLNLGGIAGAIIISRSDNIRTLIAGFCILGISFGNQSISYAIPSEILPRRYRSLGQASLNVVAGVGGIVGILVAGALLKDNNVANFRIYWYIVAGLYFIALAGVAVGYRPPPRQLERSLSTKQKINSLDWTGTSVLTAALVTFCVALEYSDNPYTWSNAHVVAPFAVSIVLYLLFAVYEWRFKTDGIMNHQLFSNKNFAMSITATFVEGVAYFTTNSYFTREVQILTRTNLFEACLRYCILFVATVTFALLAGFYTAWTKKLCEPLSFGFIVFIIFNFIMASVKTSTSPIVFWGYPVVGGMGLGCLLTELTVAAQMSTPKDMISVTTGIVISVRSLGGAIGVAVNNAVYNQALSRNLVPKIAAAVLPLGFPQQYLSDLVAALSSGSSEALSQVPNATSAIIRAASAAEDEAYVLAFRNVWICAAAFSGAGLVG